jgi:class 3 adenylate cyclase/tetratricopeptide (TPR) repeat protein
LADTTSGARERPGHRLVGVTLRAGTWTVLFTDVVGSTDQRVRLGDASVDRLLREHDAIVARALAAHGGELVGGTGDGAMCAFAGAANALAAAVAIQQQLDRRNRDAPEQLHVRAGVSLGDLAFEDGGLHGLAAHEAARVCASAEPGEILVSDVVRTVAGSRAGFELLAGGELELKGLPTPVRVWRVAWEPAPEPERLPFPPLLESRQALAFSGRAEELATILDTWNEASGGSRRCVVASGEAGIGKTRLVAEAARVAYGDGAVVLYGRCDDELGVPFQPFAEALDSYVARADEVVAGRWPGDLARLAPDLSAQVRNLPPPLEGDAESEQYRLFDAVASWLTTLSSEQPVVLVLDDLHWATEPTLLMVRHVVRNTGPARLLLVVTYRETDIGAEHPLAATLASLCREPGVERITLGGLDADALGALLETAGYELDTAGVELRDTLVAETDGNPFFVTEILRHLAESGAIRRGNDGRWIATTAQGPLSLPTSVREVITHRVARLGDDAQQILTLAAVIGREFDLKLLAEVTGFAEELALEAVEEALGAHLVDESVGTVDRFAFAHAIVRNVIYGDTPASRRVRIHRRIGEALERLLGGQPHIRLMELAHHFIEAASPGTAKTAAKYAAAAAAEAEASLAFEEALDLCQRGLAALAASHPDPTGVRQPEACDLLLRLGRAQLLSGRDGGRETLLRAFEMAEALGDSDRMAFAVLSVNRGFFARIGRTDGQLVGAIERAIANRPPGNDAVTAELLATLASELVWAADGDRRFQLADQALAMARQIDDLRTLARVLLLRTLTISAPDTLTKRIAECHELARIADELQDPVIGFHAAFQGGTALESGDFEGASEMVDRAGILAGELRQPRLVWQASVMRTSRRILEGALEDAEQQAIDTLELGRRAEQNAEAFIFFTEQMLEIRRWQDRLNEMLAEFRDVAGVDGIDFGYSLVRYLYDAGEEQAAAACYETVMRRVQLPPRRDMLAAATLDNLAYLAARVGDRERARQIYDVLVPFGNAFATTTLAKPVGRHYLGMLASATGQADLAQDHFAAAVVIHEKARAPLWLAETQVEWARLLLHRGQEDRAASLLDAVQRTAARHGAHFLEQRCMDLSIRADDP